MTSSMNFRSFSCSSLVRSEYSKSIPVSLEHILSGPGRTEYASAMTIAGWRFPMRKSLLRAAADSGGNPWQCERPFSRAVRFGVREEKPMKITSFEAIALKVPEDDPLANMPEEAGRTRPAVALRLRTNTGIEGLGVTLYGRMMKTLHTAVDELAALTVGEDPMRIEAIVAKLRN